MKSWTFLKPLLVIAPFCAILSSCAVTHTGERTRFLAKPDAEAQKYFPGLYADEESGNVIREPGAFNLYNLDYFWQAPFSGRWSMDDDKILKKMDQNGVILFPEEQIQLSISDPRRIPARRRGEQLYQELFQKNTTKEPEALFDMYEKYLRQASALTQVPVETITTKVGDKTYMYPDVRINLAAVSGANISKSRFVQLGAYIRLDEDSPAKIVGFYLPEAGVEKVPLGAFSQSSTTKAILRNDDNDKVEDTVEKGSNNTFVDEDGDNSGQTFEYAFNEGFSKSLTDAYTKGHAAIVDDGKGFFVQLDALYDSRLEGTHPVDLQLQVEGEASVRATVYLVGIVSHCVEKGFIGYLHRAPESTNDDVYEQVIVRKWEDRELWSSEGMIPATPAPMQTIHITTNNDDAVVAITDKDGVWVGKGTGRNIKIRSKRFFTSADELVATFYPVSTITDKGTVVRLNPGTTLQNYDPTSKDIHIINNYEAQ